VLLRQTLVYPAPALQTRPLNELLDHFEFDVPLSFMVFEPDLSDVFVLLILVSEVFNRSGVRTLTSGPGLRAKCVECCRSSSCSLGSHSSAKDYALCLYVVCSSQ